MCAIDKILLFSSCKPNKLMIQCCFFKNYVFLLIFIKYYHSWTFVQVHTESKPPYSFSCLIFMAIEDSPIKALPVKDIYGWIVDHFPYYKNAPTGWKNSVRHNLSLNKCFRKVEKAPVSIFSYIWYYSYTNYYETTIQLYAIKYFYVVYNSIHTIYVSRVHYTFKNFICTSLVLCRDITYKHTTLWRFFYLLIKNLTLIFINLPSDLMDILIEVFFDKRRQQFHFYGISYSIHYIKKKMVEVK